MARNVKTPNLRSVLNGFDSFTLDPSSQLRRRASAYHAPSHGTSFVAVWVEVGQVIREAAKQVMAGHRELT